MLLESNIFELRDIQKEAIKKGLFFGHSFLICAPSGSGKTLIGETCAMNNVFQGLGKSIFLVPFKALASQKYQHFKSAYERFGVMVELSIGDYDVDEEQLIDADLIITTYEKMDSILRNFNDTPWIHQISTVIIDEIHIIADQHRGPRLESLIVRLNEFLHNPQIIGLSATISNPESFNNWLTSLGNESHLIYSNKRPVPLKLKILLTHSKNSTIRKVIKSTLQKKGQVLIFVNRRKGTSGVAHSLHNYVKQWMTTPDLNICKALKKELTAINGGNQQLQKVIQNGIAFHHAGLLPKERKIVEKNYKAGHLKVICCTTTLSAGLNLPARVVLVHNFKKFSATHYQIKDFSNFYELGDGFNYFKPFGRNEMFQMLGRAGRPGLDSVGYGVILVKNYEEKLWVEEHYFQGRDDTQKLIPQYNQLHSTLNNTNTLKEQVLLRVFDEQKISLEKLKTFFEKSFFWYLISKKNKKNQIPLDQFLMIKEITPINILKLHTDKRKVKSLMKTANWSVKLDEISARRLKGVIRTQFGVYVCAFDVEKGVQCTCGFENGLNDNFVTNNVEFIFCDHITCFLIDLIRNPDSKLKKYVNDIVPKSVKNQYILNYLLEKGLIQPYSEDESQLVCSQFGKLVIRLYIQPATAVLIRDYLEDDKITDNRSLAESVFEILKKEHRIRKDKFFEALIDWVDEIPINEIIEKYKIDAGDLYNLAQNAERTVSFINIIASRLANTSYDHHDTFIGVAERCETMALRIRYGIREQLFDLVLRVDYVGRVRARILYNAGYHTADHLIAVDPYELNRKTGIGINWCKKIIAGILKKKENV